MTTILDTTENNGLDAGHLHLLRSPLDIKGFSTQLAHTSTHGIRQGTGIET